MPDELKWMIERQIPHMRRYALALTRDRDTADEIVQDSLERALRKRHLWKRRGSIRSWLFRILYRQSIEHFRRLRPETVPADAGTIDRAAAQPANQEMRIDCLRVAEALDRLPAEQRAVVLLAALEGLAYDEIAEITDVPVGTIRSRLSRARETLRLFRDAAPPERRTAKLRTIK
ncbi:RNA polymerase sigma factor [Roseibium salinum]|uniref:Sigma-70 family RNA polymerase sigma factor n=1 Tax=Roseibium salinum TaxID=1604349 RepID=A0ABT3R246_9HYPH|nr:sigma-70 family RNA polymerase sigma factor [Roseibium sp. DSM 29163]MCX2723273.1 sigma-70 family RNA polymerase sigma factor [Roseibium sp. DSM 29163]MDN3718814.1 sigma-70 family RNA polymerase sigma factor [Roseibium salinum]